MKHFRLTCTLVVLLLALVASAFIAAHPTKAQSLNPPPPSFESCKTVGNGTICQGKRTFSYGPDDTGIVCGSGVNAFDIYDSATNNQDASRSSAA